jgi:hypothetical protein
MAKSNQIKNRKFRRDRRGVGAIMGGVLLVAILLTTMLLYFITILDNDQRRASYDIQSAQINSDKGAESLKATRDQNLFTNVTGSYINTLMSNDGSLPLIVSYSGLYCLDAGCPTPNNPLTARVDDTLNAKEASTLLVGPVTDGLNYRVDLITERGNVVSTEECAVDLGSGICTNDISGGEPDFSLSASPITIVLEAGKSGTSVITVTSLNGFSAQVDLSSSTPAAGIGSSFSDGGMVTPPAGSSNSSTLTITSATSTIPGTYTMVITGTSGLVNHTTAVGVTILEEECVDCAVTEGIIQGTGSLQLDFKAFGVIYPQLGMRDGVDQTGWDATVASKYSSAHGYPGYQLMTITAKGGSQNSPAVSTTQLIVVESARNLDQSGEALTLTRFSGINPSLGAIQGSNSQLSFICHENTSAKTVTAYDEDTANKILPHVALNAGPTVGWTEMYFCTTLAGKSPNYFSPEDLKFANLTPLFLVARGDFEDGSPYSQTIPYQAFTIGKGPGTNIMNACLLDQDVNVDCPTYDFDQSDDTQFRYYATDNQLQAGVTVYLHLNPGTTFTDGIDIRWLHPDGTYETLVDNEPASVVNGLRNIPVELPTGIACSSAADEFHTLVFNDGRDNTGDRYIYYMTFKVDC